MSNQFFTNVSIEQQEIVTGGGRKLHERNYSDSDTDTIHQVTTTIANDDCAETYHELELSEVDEFPKVKKHICFYF
jgi:hypothetical protein